VTDSLNDYNVDVSSQEGVDIHINDSNYIYLRGNCTRAVEMQTSLYAVPNTMVLYPEMYGNEPVMDVGPDGRKIAIRDFTTKTPGPHVIDDPFNFFNPTSPASKGFDHYCLIAEARIPGDVWPHEDPLPTGYDITNWLLNNPNIAQRNVYWTESFDDPTQIWQTNASIPGEYQPVARSKVAEMNNRRTIFPHRRFRVEVELD
jgi:hypothetical protein